MKLDLVGWAEVAEILGVSKGRARRIRSEHPWFPATVCELRCGPVWWREEIEEFALVRRVRKDRPVRVGS